MHIKPFIWDVGCLPRFPWWVEEWARSACLAIMKSPPPPPRNARFPLSRNNSALTPRAWFNSSTITSLTMLQGRHLHFCTLHKCTCAMCIPAAITSYPCPDSNAPKPKLLYCFKVGRSWYCATRCSSLNEWVLVWPKNLEIPNIFQITMFRTALL